MSDNPRRMPVEPQMFRAEVVRTERTSRSFQRVTVGGPQLESFPSLGFDQWFRLFLPRTPSGELTLPEVEGRSWWQPYLAIPEDVRPHCSNYTVAGLRRTPSGIEMDIDVVLHWDAADELVGTVAVWAVGTRAGHLLALLDQGVLFDPPEDTGELVLVSDETGVPALRGIVHELPDDTRGRVLVEVPHTDDVEHWSAPNGLDVTWLPRRSGEEVPGQRALAALQDGPAPSTDAYAVVVGESALATGGRRWLVASGLAKNRILFSGFWKREPTEELTTTSIV